MQLTNVNSQTQVAYQPTLWAKLFHSAPHVNITFHHVGSKFNPENELYLESLGILASVPAGKMDKDFLLLFMHFYGKLIWFSVKENTEEFFHVV